MRMGMFAARQFDVGWLDIAMDNRRGLQVQGVDRVTNGNDPVKDLGL